MVRPGGDVPSLRAYVQLPQHVSDELLHVLMATVVEGDARALSVGQWCGGHDPIRVDDDGLIVRLRELHECHERSILPVGRASRARRPQNLRRAGVKVKPVYRKHKGEALQMACGVCARSTRRAAFAWRTPETDTGSRAQVGIVSLPRASITAHIRLSNGRFVMVYPVVLSMNEARAGFEIF